MGDRHEEILTVTEEGSEARLVTRGVRSIRAADLIAHVGALVTRNRYLEHLRSHHGPEFIAGAALRYLEEAGRGPLFIEPGAL